MQLTTSTIPAIAFFVVAASALTTLPARHKETASDGANSKADIHEQEGAVGLQRRTTKQPPQAEWFDHAGPKKFKSTPELYNTWAHSDMCMVFSCTHWSQCWDRSHGECSHCHFLEGEFTGSCWATPPANGPPSPSIPSPIPPTKRDAHAAENEMHDHDTPKKMKSAPEIRQTIANEAECKTLKCSTDSQCQTNSLFKCAECDTTTGHCKSAPKATDPHEPATQPPPLSPPQTPRLTPQRPPPISNEILTDFEILHPGFSVPRTPPGGYKAPPWHLPFFCNTKECKTSEDCVAASNGQCSICVRKKDEQTGTCLEAEMAFVPHRSPPDTPAKPKGPVGEVKPGEGFF